MTLIGCLIALVLLVTGHKPKKFHYFVYFEFGQSWGGFECGCFFFTSKNPSLHIKQHESGHGLQNIVLGVFMPFAVSIPSAARYWLREFNTQKNKKIYSIVVYVALILIAALTTLIPLLSKIYAWFILPALIVLYSTGLFIWLFFIETPKYAKGYVDYDSIWFEGSATALGEKYFSEIY